MCVRDARYINLTIIEFISILLVCDNWEEYQLMHFKTTLSVYDIYSLNQFLQYLRMLVVETSHLFINVITH